MSENPPSLEDFIFFTMKMRAQQYYEWQKCYRLMQEIWEAMRTQKDWDTYQKELISAVPAFREDLRRTVKKSGGCLTPPNAEFLWGCDSNPSNVLTTDLTREEVEQGIVSEAIRQNVQKQRNQEKS
jgi:hypothetical protein